MHGVSPLHLPLFALQLCAGANVGAILKPYVKLTLGPHGAQYSSGVAYPGSGEAQLRLGESRPISGSKAALAWSIHDKGKCKGQDSGNATRCCRAQRYISGSYK